MAKSLTQIQSQIEKLQKQVDAVRSAAVVRIRKEMAQHGLTADDLFGPASSTSTGSGRATKGKIKTKGDRPPKYVDGSGNTWGGMGKRPAWIREALEAGRSLEEFLVGAAPKPAKAAKPGRKPAAKKAAPAAAPKKVAAKRPGRKKATDAASASPES
ncbi:H-NS family nucleoid-associated regulatory protein [Pelomonas parva]|uniref:H-NS family nucleoid-associated regulatory protein n=1 Tax=Pelomonas parva TaxID=3299032 RepID=A0ABW7EX45_9BURK